MEISLVPCAVTAYGYPIFVEDCEAYRKDLKWLMLCSHVEEALLAIFIAVQMSMVGFLLVHGRRDKTFRQAFYIFFVAVTIADCLLVIVRRIDYYNHDIVRRYILGDDFVLSHQLKYVTNIVLPVVAAGQPLLHLAIAVNRLTAFALPLTNSDLWRPRRIAAVLVAVALVSILIGTAGPLWLAVRRWGCPVASRSMSKNVAGLNWICQQYGTGPDQLLVDDLSYGFLSVSYILWCAISIVLNACTIAILVVLRRAGKLRNMGCELRLFFHSFVMFLVQTILACQFFFVFFDHLQFLSQTFGFESLFEWAADGLGAANSAALFGVTDLCITVNTPADNVSCGLLFGVVTGYATLAGCQSLTAGSLVQHVFSLSGSIFLLAMSRHS